MTDPLDDLDALLAAATPGRWRYVERRDRSGEWFAIRVEADEGGAWGPVVDDDVDVGSPLSDDEIERERADAALIVALRNAAPELLAVARAAARYTSRSHHVDRCAVRTRRGTCDCGLDDTLDAFAALRARLREGA